MSLCQLSVRGLRQFQFMGMHRFVTDTLHEFESGTQCDGLHNRQRARFKASGRIGPGGMILMHLIDHVSAKDQRISLCKQLLATVQNANPSWAVQFVS